MKTKTRTFLKTLLTLIKRDTDESKRLVKKLEESPEKAAETVYHLLGTSTQKLSFKNTDEHI